VCRDFDAKLREKIYVVPNGVDPALRDAASDWFYQQTGLTDFVLCVGSVYSRKNQLTLVRALNQTELHLVLVGPTPSKRYLKMCRRYCKGRLHIVGAVSHPAIGAIYSRAAVHAQPSWYETPGLSSLEAALFGCRVVATIRGTARDYFGNLAQYCEPDNTASVRKAVLKALDEPRHEALQKRIATDFTWDKAAHRTMEAYARIMPSGVAA
jgi:glycosyltransferase involved in cell wall biosynthesis